MKLKRIFTFALAAILVSSCFAGCSKEQEIPEITKPVVAVTDADDDVKVDVDSEEKATLELTDLDGNVLTAVPVYNSDGVSIIAVYIESAKSKDGKALDEKSYAYIKQVIAVEFDEENNCLVKYDENKKFITMTALADEKGYIVAIQDTIDLDKDKDTTEYFKVVTKIDNSKNLFIKLDKDAKGKLINVTVKTEKDGEKTLTTSDGKTQKVVESVKAQNLVETAEKVVEEREKTSTTKKDSAGANGSDKDNSSNSGSGGSDNSGDDAKEPNDDNNNKEPESPAVDYTAIVLKKGGQIECSAKNVKLAGSAANGGMEVIVDGAGEYSKYYVTSETDTFSGQMEFRFSIGEDVEVKFNDVNISTQKKTAIKFTDVDKENQKENDGEESGAGTGNFGSSVEAAAPKVELSFTGSNSFRAAGSGTNGTIYSECKLGIKGHGTADIDGGPNLSGICSTESVTIKNATLNITSKAKQGISCDRKVTVETGATINIDSMGDGIHCNKFEYEGDSTSKITIKSLTDSNSADGIDTNDWIIIDGGRLDVTALTPGKYALKVRKIIKQKSGVFTINGGTVTASGATNSRPTACGQNTVLATAAKTGQFTVGDYKSADKAKSFICSSTSAKTASFAGTSKDIGWSGKLGTVTF